MSPGIYHHTIPVFSPKKVPLPWGNFTRDYKTHGAAKKQITAFFRSVGLCLTELFLWQPYIAKYP